jgi:phosphorylated adapter RNA export protein
MNDLSQFASSSSNSKPSQQLDISEMGRPSKAHKRFSIWSDVLMEESLAEGLHNSVKVDLGPDTRGGHDDRDVESYPIRQRDKDGKRDSRRKNPNPRSTKSWLDDKFGKHGRKGRKESHNHDRGHGTEREKYSVEDRRKLSKKKKARRHRTEEENISLDIASKLKEHKIALIRKAVAVVGVATCQRICSETLTIEDAGGMMTENGERRRSPGGVFFYLLRSDKHVTHKQTDELFAVDPNSLHQQMRKLNKKAKKKLKKQMKSNRSKSSSIPSAESLPDNPPEESIADVALPLENLSLQSPPPNPFKLQSDLIEQK